MARPSSIASRRDDRAVMGATANAQLIASSNQDHARAQSLVLLHQTKEIDPRLDPRIAERHDVWSHSFARRGVALASGSLPSLRPLSAVNGLWILARGIARQCSNPVREF